MSLDPLRSLGEARTGPARTGITSVCSAHPIVIEAALRLAQRRDRPALIEATCNQVNQDGGYTGLTPKAFRQFVEETADRVGCDRERIILGGDHLGPNPFRAMPAEQAMVKAEAMIGAYAAAGFSKLHLDTSMGCQGEPPALSDDLTAQRAARLAAVAERHAVGPVPPAYVIGTEVPVPGGAAAGAHNLVVTTPDAAKRTYRVHRDAFAAAGEDAAFERVIALVVQPGVEFGDEDIDRYEPAAAAALSASLNDLPGIVFEAHSTDYQSPAALVALVHDGFAILKVGPLLTFVLREALYGLDAVADVLEGGVPRGRLMAALDDAMLAEPEHYARYYSGDETELRLKRHFSLSDRIRYYWPLPPVRAAVDELLSRLGDRLLPGPLLSQFLPRRPDATSGASAHGALLGAVEEVLALYDDACHPTNGARHR